MSGRSFEAGVLFGIVLLTSLPAADLFQELAWSGPVCPHTDLTPPGASPSLQATPSHDPGDPGRILQQWWSTALVGGSTRQRQDGLLVVERESDPLDAQLALGWLRDSSITYHDHIFSDIDFSYLRIGARVGTDPLATQAGRAMGAASLVWCAPILLSTIIEGGRSAERGWLVHAEVSLFPLRAVWERDDWQTTTRIGTGPRTLGSDGPWAWGVLGDITHTELAGPTNRSATGYTGEAWVAWRCLNWLVFAVQMEGANTSLSADAASDGQRMAGGSLAISVVR